MAGGADPEERMTTRRLLVRGLLLAPLATLAACASLTVSRMVPDTGPAPAAPIPQGVRLASVEGGRSASFGGAAMLEDKTIREAVLATLRKARLFASVSETEGDIDLAVKVLSQDQVVGESGFLHYKARLVVAYTFSDRAGAPIWRETYETSFSSSAFSGATRTVEAREGAIRLNLAELVTGVKERWPRR